MQTITTKYLPATNTLGSRIKAQAYSFSVTIPFDYSLTDDEVHKKAVIALTNKLEWSGEMVGGTLGKGGDSMVWVFINDSHLTLDYVDSSD